MTIRHRSSEDPVTVIGLIYRIVDEPRRAFTLTAVLLPILAAAVQVIAPRATLEGFGLRWWWSGTGALGLGWLLRALAVRGTSRTGRRLPGRLGAAGRRDRAAGPR